MSAPRSFVFTSVVRFAFFIINVFAVYLFFRGHNLPGGGFIAGLASATSLNLPGVGPLDKPLDVAIGNEELMRILRVDPVRIAAIGMCVALLSGAAPMAMDEAFLTQFNWHWYNVPLFGELHIGTPMIFDFGVFLVVIGICCKIILTLTHSTGGSGLNEQDQRRYSSPVEVPIEEGHAAEEEVPDAD